MQSVEWLGVARPALRHSGPKLWPEPQLTISARRLEVSSNASVEACALTEASPFGGFFGSGSAPKPSAPSPAPAAKPPPAATGGVPDALAKAAAEARAKNAAKQKAAADARKRQAQERRSR